MKGWTGVAVWLPALVCLRRQRGHTAVFFKSQLPGCISLPSPPASSGWVVAGYMTRPTLVSRPWLAACAVLMIPLARETSGWLIPPAWSSARTCSRCKDVQHGEAERETATWSHVPAATSDTSIHACFRMNSIFSQAIFVCFCSF